MAGKGGRKERANEVRCYGFWVSKMLIMTMLMRLCKVVCWWWIYAMCWSVWQKENERRYRSKPNHGWEGTLLKAIDQRAPEPSAVLNSSHRDFHFLRQKVAITLEVRMIATINEVSPYDMIYICGRWLLSRLLRVRRQWISSTRSLEALEAVGDIFKYIETSAVIGYPGFWWVGYCPHHLTKSNHDILVSWYLVLAALPAIMWSFICLGRLILQPCFRGQRWP